MHTNFNGINMTSEIYDHDSKMRLTIMPNEESSDFKMTLVFDKKAANQVESLFRDFTGTSQHCNDAEEVARIMDSIDINNPEMTFVDRVNLLVDYVKAVDSARKKIDFR